MSWAKRQGWRKKRAQSLGTLSKAVGESDFERRKAEYVMRYGSEWVRHWWRDHPGLYEFDGDPRYGC
jgi:hypothetical protein